MSKNRMALSQREGHSNSPDGGPELLKVDLCVAEFQGQGGFRLGREKVTLYTYLGGGMVWTQDRGLGNQFQEVKRMVQDQPREMHCPGKWLTR